MKKATVSKKIHTIVTITCVALATASFLITLVALIAVSASTEGGGILGFFIAISLLISVLSAVFASIIASKILHKNISRPLFDVAFDIKKDKEFFNELGIVPPETDDEVAIICNLYPKIVDQLKSHIDDVLKLSGLTEKFEASANLDALTGVYNRRRFFELVQKSIVIAAKKNEPTFVIMLDLDFFKKVNDTYGHAAGDEVLKVIATRIQDTIRPYDLFGRYGGEEFIMFISVNDVKHAVSFAERVRTIVQENPIHFEGIDISITTSLGIAQAAPDSSFEEALKLSDEALYKAKRNGRNRVELYSKDLKDNLFETWTDKEENAGGCEQRHT